MDEKCCKTPFFVNAPIRSLRQQMQRGRYILFPNRISNLCNNEKKYFETIIDPIRKNDDYIADIITIPIDKKKQLIKELKLFGISEETLFSDNIDIVCKNIKETYQNKVRGEYHF